MQSIVKKRSKFGSWWLSMAVSGGMSVLVVHFAKFRRFPIRKRLNLRNSCDFGRRCRFAWISDKFRKNSVVVSFFRNISFLSAFLPHGILTKIASVWSKKLSMLQKVRYSCHVFPIIMAFYRVRNSILRSSLIKTLFRLLKYLCLDNRHVEFALFHVDWHYQCEIWLDRTCEFSRCERRSKSMLAITNAVNLRK